MQRLPPAQTLFKIPVIKIIIMKTTFYIVTCFLLIISFSCSKIDNYTAPSQTLTGMVMDATTKQPVQTEAGQSGTRIKLLETSWSDDPTPQYLASKQDGSYNDNKLFAGTYIATAEGAFAPMIQTDANGDTTVDNSQTIEIKGGTTTVDFSVEPFLNVEWVGDPVINTDGSITAQVKITRGTSNPNYQQSLTDMFLFVSNTQYAGNNNYDPRYSNQLSLGDSVLNQTISITTKGGALPGKRDYFLRVGARIDYGLKQYNYNEPVSVSIP
jgi:hypothetical protein